jgi:hypothetical protein
MDDAETWGHVTFVGSSGVVLLTRVVEGRGRPDLSVVDALARWQLQARRTGGHIVVRGLSDDLAALLDLVGLLREVAGEPEPGKEMVGIEEAVHFRDPAG